MNEKHIEEAAIELIAVRGVINFTKRELCMQAKVVPAAFFHIMECSFQDFVDGLRAKGATNGRGNPVLRKAHIMHHALDLAESTRYNQITLHQLAKAANISRPLISRYFQDVSSLRRHIIKASIIQGNAVILRQALDDKYRTASHAPKSLKNKALSL